jgi:Tfp pilus assembly protein PilZ
MARKPAEQRISRRIPVHTPAVVKFADEQLTGYIEVVNLNGMFVAASRFPTLGEYVDLIVDLPGNQKSFRVRATVVSTSRSERESPGFGARFERPPLGLLEAIRDLESEKGH